MLGQLLNSGMTIGLSTECGGWVKTTEGGLTYIGHFMENPRRLDLMGTDPVRRALGFLTHR